MKKVCVGVLIFIVGMFIGGFLLYTFFPTIMAQTDKSIAINVNYGDALFFDDVEMPELTSRSGYNLVAYVSSSCSSCISAIESVERIESIWGATEVGKLYIWEDKIPQNADMPTRNVISLRGKYSASPVVPTFFIVDNSYNVIYKDTDMENVVSKLLSFEILPTPLLRENADNYLLALKRQEGEKDLIVYFSMTGCPDCTTADEIIETSEVIRQKYDILRIYRSTETDSSKLRDNCNIFRNIYGIVWYPSFLIFDGSSNARFIGEVPTDQLEQTILGDE